ncbi:MAG: hypothetical protein KJ600_06650 [Nanoarchaeota archaeon]|nr:hypothetical protein [Nanoarchaeota archaeon]
MAWESLAIALSFEEGLDFVIHLAFILTFLLFLWYIFGVNYKSEKERKKHNWTAFLYFLLIVFISLLQIMGIILFFPSGELFIKPDKIIGIPIFILVFLIGILILNKVGKNRLRT